MPIEEAVRFSYIYATEEWKEDLIRVRVEPNPFAAGAMRNAYKMKIVTEDGSTTDWVAKGYIKPQDNEEKILKEDVILQMSAAHYGWECVFLCSCSNVQIRQV